MGGETPDDAALGEEERLAADSRRRFALLRVILAVPALGLGLITVAAAYRMANRPFDAIFWVVAAPIVLGFAAFAGHALWQVRRRRPAPRPEP